MESATHLSDYLEILRRRRRQIVRVAAAVFMVAVAAAIFLPPVYRSTAELLIENEVPSDLVPSTVSGYVSQRVKVVEARILTADNLLHVAEKIDLYPSERARGASAVAARMRHDIKIEPISADVTDPRSGAQRVATIAFNVSYDAKTPELAQQAAQALAALFVEENRVIRTAKARQTTGFLSEEEERLRKHIAELEAKLADYKEKNQGRLPELMNLNMQMLDRTQRELEETDRQINNLEQRRVELQSQLALVEPYTGNSPGARLREVQSEYLLAASRYSPDHPDVIRLKRELDALKREAGITDDRATVERQYKKAVADLGAAREKYAPDHPDVVKLQRTVDTLGAQLKHAPGAASGFALKPDNPAYVTLQTQIDTTELNLKALKESRERAKQLVAQYESRLEQTPRVEQEGLALQRDYDAATKKYREIRQNLMSANLALELEKEQKGERYSILEPPKLPDAPERPNRKAFLLIGLVLGIGSGVGYASLAEYMDRTVRGARAIAGLLGAPPLAVIPYIPNGIDPPARLT